MTKFVKEPKKIVLNEVEVQKDDLFNNNKKHLENAKKQLSIAHEIEKNKIENGYRYMRKEKTAKLVHPDKIKELSKDGWKLLNKTK